MGGVGAAGGSRSTGGGVDGGGDTGVMVGGGDGVFEGGKSVLRTMLHANRSSARGKDRPQLTLVQLLQKIAELQGQQSCRASCAPAKICCSRYRLSARAPRRAVNYCRWS